MRGCGLEGYSIHAIERAEGGVEQAAYLHLQQSVPRSASQARLPATDKTRHIIAIVRRLRIDDMLDLNRT